MTQTFSIEFFPPATPEGVDKLRATRAQLVALNPAYFSVTYGAGGSTRDRTLAIVREIQAEGLSAAPHLSCIGATAQSIREHLAEFREIGVKRIVALRGDLPSGMADPGEFRYANELVQFIRQESGEEFHIEVAAYPEFHPQARNAQQDIDAFVRKMEAGADAAITQYFYNADAYFRFVDVVRGRGVTAPIVAGIMPIASYSKLARFSDACGAEIPQWMRRRFESFGDDADSVRAFGLDVVTDLCERLLAGGAPGLHFYTLNQAGLTREIWQRLRLSNQDSSHT
ncbi:methylenetetrahydrofolate reductase [NAD(P)H] [Uliginosibacterium sp. H1]|uniref:methylenetetrahydrofolate reductase [NAD(P)H] n=1 Tax=Uliginosibacterium sp. H1 TaxID=3114757 RepID=UPI002E17A363|nr:methylenetetrahydrofolate reductase [NAD(P)H] [Uliginosibacterium sp. H1]